MSTDFLHPKALLALSRSKSSLCAMEVILSAMLFLSCTTSTIHAAIIRSGDLDPLDPNKWTAGTLGYIGKSATGTVTVDGGSGLLSNVIHLGYDAGSTGTATVTGTGSKWTNGFILFIGYSGNGTLNIQSSGQISNKRCFLGANAGSTGTATVTGTGSKWTNSGELYIGSFGSGALRVEASAQVSNTAGFLGSETGSTGTATITGAGSTWINSGDLYVGNFGRGTLTVNNGGTVTVAKAIFASLSDLSGNGTISANGGVLDTDLIFDATHGFQKSFAFGTGGTLNFNHTGTSALGAGYKGNGTLRIANGIDVPSFSGYLGYHAGSSGIATITGTGSKWTNNSNLQVGRYGNGTLNIEAGGWVSNYSSGYLGYEVGSIGTATITGMGSTWYNSGDLYVGNAGSGTLTVNDGGRVTVGKGLFASLDSLFGNGAITTNGGVLDADLIFDATHGFQRIFAFGTGGILNFNHTGTSALGAGYHGNGTLRIADGMVVPSSYGYLGYCSGSIGTATVTGAGSTWNNSNDLKVGCAGSGMLIIEAGGQVFNSFGQLDSGTVTVTGVGSKWSNRDSLTVGSSRNGILNIEAGGQVDNDKGYIGSNFGSSGTVTVTGVGSKWGNRGDLIVGSNGSGMLNIAAGGQVTNYGSILGDWSGSTGTVTVTGTDSKWIHTLGIRVGDAGNGTLNIGSGTESGGLVMASFLLLADRSSSRGICNINGGILQVGAISQGSGLASFNWDDGTIRNYDANTNLIVSNANNLVLKLAATGTHAFQIDANRTGTVDAVLSDATSGGTFTKTGLGLLTLTAANTYSGDTSIDAGTLSIRVPYLNDLAGIHIASGAKFDLKFPGSDMVSSLYLNGVPMALGTWGSSSSSATYINDLHFSGTGMLNVVPEPSMLILLGVGVLGLLPWTWRRR